MIIGLRKGGYQEINRRIPDGIGDFMLQKMFAPGDLPPAWSTTIPETPAEGNAMRVEVQTRAPGPTLAPTLMPTSSTPATEHRRRWQG